MTISVMLDLETWGTKPGCDLRSIGAAVFDPTCGQIGSPEKPGFFHVAVDNPAGRWRNGEFVAELAKGPNDRRYPLTRDPETVQWWNDQSDEAKGAFVNPVDLREGLINFGTWLTSLDDYPGTGPAPAIRIWAHGPSFDVSILEAAFNAVDLPTPWHYRAPRDTRTIFEAAGMDPHKCLDDFATGTFHNALDDAITQAKAVCEAYNRLGLSDGVDACKTEADHFMVEAAIQLGFEPTNDDANRYRCSESALLRMIRSARKQGVIDGQRDTDARVTELLAANNVAVEKRREACGLLREAMGGATIVGDDLAGRIETFLASIRQ